MLVPATLGESFRSFFDAVDSFFSNLADVHLGSLFLALVLFGIYLTLRARASFNILRAAYPTETFRFLDIWGAYFAGYGFNAVVPARGGDVVRLFLTKTSVPRSSYPAVAASFAVEAGFDLAMGILILGFAFTQGVFPKPPDFADLNAFDLSYLASHPRFTLFLLTAIGVASLVAFAMLSMRVKAFWARVRQGLTILYDRDRYLREVFAVQFAGWLFRFAAFWFLLEAFNIGGLGEERAAGPGRERRRRRRAVHAPGRRRDPGAAGQGVRGHRTGRHRGGLLGGPADRARRVRVRVGFAALFFIFRVRSFKEIIARGREDRAADKVARAGGLAGARRRGPAAQPAPPLRAAGSAGTGRAAHQVAHQEVGLVGHGGLELGIDVDLEVADRVAHELGVGRLLRGLDRGSRRRGGVVVADHHQHRLAQLGELRVGPVGAHRQHHPRRPRGSPRCCRAGRARGKPGSASAAVMTASDPGGPTAGR